MIQTAHVYHVWRSLKRLLSFLVCFVPYAGDHQSSRQPNYSVEVRFLSRLYSESQTDNIKGPTIDFAASLRGRKSDAKPGKQAVWDLFATGAKSRQPSKVVQLSQHWTSNTLTIELHRYVPMETDKQHYTWYEDDIERHYDTPPYGIANWRKVHFSIERFMEQNFKQYIDAHLRDASEIPRKTFEIALEHKVLVFQPW